MKVLLVVERIVLESICRKNTKLDEIAFDTDLDKGVLRNILRYLIDQNILKYKNAVYSLNIEHKEKWIDLLKSKKNLQEEVNELLSSHVKSYFEDELNYGQSLALKKISLTSSEEKLLQAHLVNLDAFVKNIEMDQSKRNNKDRTYKKTVLFWGHSQYSKLIEKTLQAV